MIAIQGLQKRFGTNTVLDNLTFRISEGDVFGIVGHSGAGKSTLLRCLAGLTSVDSGKILIQGQDIVPLPPQQRGIGMVFQSYALFPNMSVEANVSFGLKMQKLPAAEVHRRVGEVLELVEMSDYAKRYPHQLSGGQCQRVALARSLVTQPRLLLLDEPLSALDARIRKHLREQIRRIQREMNLTAIFVTHDQEEALTMSDRIVLMNKGQIVQNADAETLYTEPVDAFAAGFIGSYNLLSPEQAMALTGMTYTGRVAIRPESVTMCELIEGIPAKILSHSLLGNVVRYRVLAHGVELSVDVLNRSVASLRADGSDIGLQLDLVTLREVA